MRLITAAAIGLALMVLGCSGGGGGGGGGDGGDETPGAPLVLAAGLERIDTATDATWTVAIDTKRLGLRKIGRVYDLTTPADVPFAFDLITRAPGNTGEVRVSLAHAVDGTTEPDGNIGSLADAGIVVTGAGAVRRDDWIDVPGDGFARVTVRGTIEDDQVIAVEASDGDSTVETLVRIRIGESSAITVEENEPEEYGGILDRTTIYSSNSWRFGLPTIAVSGDRTSMVCYEGDQTDPHGTSRFELRLQHDRTTGQTTTGATLEPTLFGDWRDHEIAALYNVLAVARCGEDSVTLKLSFDRGATFGQVVDLVPPNGDAPTGYMIPRVRTRLAQIAMATDYSIAVVFWATRNANRDGSTRRRPWVSTDLFLIEGRPLAFDAHGSPTAFEFDAPTRIHRADGDAMPLLMQAAWSEGGDLVVGYAFTVFEDGPDNTWTVRTQNRCAVRPYDGELEDTLVHEDEVVGKDPSVAVLGTGESLRIFYAFESTGGIRLSTSADAGRTFLPVVVPEDPFSYNPTVFARARTGGTTVDLLYLTETPDGNELHLLHWADLAAGNPTKHQLTEAVTIESASVPPGEPAPGLDEIASAPPYGRRVTHVTRFGYDAVVEDDDIVVVYDEQTFDGWYYFTRAPGGISLGGTMADAESGFMPADPPPLAEGMTEPAPEPDPDDMHQLKLLRLDR